MSSKKSPSTEHERIMEALKKKYLDLYDVEKVPSRYVNNRDYLTEAVQRGELIKKHSKYFPDVVKARKKKIDELNNIVELEQTREEYEKVFKKPPPKEGGYTAAKLKKDIEKFKYEKETGESPDTSKTSKQLEKERKNYDQVTAYKNIMSKRHQKEIEKAAEEPRATTPKQTIKKMTGIYTIKDIKTPQPPPKPSHLRGKDPTITLTPATKETTPKKSPLSVVSTPLGNNNNNTESTPLKVKGSVAPPKNWFKKKDPDEIKIIPDPEYEEIGNMMIRKNQPPPSIDLDKIEFEDLGYNETTSKIKKRVEEEEDDEDMKRAKAESLKTANAVQQRKKKILDEKQTTKIQEPDEIDEFFKQRGIDFKNLKKPEKDDRPGPEERRKNLEKEIAAEARLNEDVRKYKADQSHELKKIGLTKGLEIGGEVVKGGIELGRTALQGYYADQQTKTKGDQDRETLKLQNELLMKAKEFEYQLQDKYMGSEIERQKQMIALDVEKQSRMKDIDVDKGKSFTEFDIQKSRAQNEGLKEIKQIEGQYAVQRAQQEAMANQANTQQYIGLLNNLISTGGQVGSAFFNRGATQAQVMGHGGGAMPAIYINNKNISGAGAGRGSTTTRTPRPSKVRKNPTKEAMSKAKETIKGKKSNR